MRVLLIGNLPEINEILARTSSFGKPLSRIDTLDAAGALAAAADNGAGNLLPHDLADMPPDEQAALMAIFAVHSGQAEACVSCAEEELLLRLAKEQLAPLRDGLQAMFCAVLPVQRGRQYLVDTAVRAASPAVDFGALALAGVSAAAILEKRDNMPTALLGDTSAPLSLVRKADARLRNAAEQLADMAYQGIVSADILFSEGSRVLLCGGESRTFLLQALYAAAREAMRVISTRRGLLKGGKQRKKEREKLHLLLQPLLSYDALLLGFSHIVMKSSHLAQRRQFTAVLGNTLRVVQGRLVERIAQGLTQETAVSV